LNKPNIKTKRSDGTVDDYLIFDLEANGLYHDVTQIHCIAFYNPELDEVESFNDECDWKNPSSAGKGMSSPIVRAIQYIEQAKVIIGHNIIGYDIPVIRKLYPFFDPVGTVIDTLLLSRLYHPRLMSLDKEKNWKHMPLQLYGRHSLESYGYRLGEYKGDYGKTTDWKEWSQELEDYCIQDVIVTRKLCDHFHPYLSGLRSNTR
jgi:DNA polymerase III alpha subunit (gram-positive type)|tara:strand:- start:26 stop:637 length:612 start_codon:yes stop_codon:yes gene_type:complete